MAKLTDINSGGKNIPVPQESLADVSIKLNFSKALHAVTNRIHATSNIDEIIFDLGKDICTLFNSDRLTIYVVSDDKSSIISKVKTGLSSFKDLRLPISEQSVAGYVALHRKMVNVKDVYDDKELQSYSPHLHFMREVDKRTGYRTKQMLVAPVIDSADNELIGVVQIINNKFGLPFQPMTEEGVIELAKTLAIALKQRQRSHQLVRTRFDVLIADGVISAVEFDLASRSARRRGVSLEEVLIDEFQVKPPALGKSLSHFFGVDYEPFKPDRIRPSDLLKNIKRDYVEANQWVPVDDTKDGLVIISPDPERIQTSRIVNNVFPKHRLVFRVCSQREFTQTVNQFFGNGVEEGSSIGELLSSMDGEAEAEDVSDDISAAADNELVKLVNKIIMDAHKMGASDIHIEPFPGKGKTQVRFRKDGTLLPYVEVPSNYRNAIVARIKIMCDLDISEKRRPQDGKIQFRKYAPLNIELRVATIPSAGGVEDIVMRILASGDPIPLDKIGLAPGALATLKNTVTKPYGLFLVCGPTGSGKTTTLHSVLGFINTPQTKIWTAEDPVEITQKGLRQVQMNPKAGFTFAVAMRAFLRADPDVIMVGEMRDQETTAVGIEASLTGHMVMSTLHTNSAPESIVRLLDMGMDPFNFADAILGILAQRLIKRLCRHCKKAEVASQEEIRLLLAEYCEELKHTEVWKRDPNAALKEKYGEWVKSYANEHGEFTLYHAVGCPECNGIGYSGRLGIFELLTGSDTIKRHIQERSRVAEIVATALAEGMRTLKQDGIEKVLQGITDMQQVRAACIK
ncbi:MAG: Flp pilus assembly complex ATPase component TadA [Burkholderiales bacterium]|nr:Flp pilus assembly complex ATPase component TadA [Burkholderiales bacterium]